MRATRDAYGHALIDLAGRRDDLIVLDADLSRSTRTNWFQERWPDRFINVGIAEQNMIGIAAGLALGGFVPFATTYAIFVSRALDQIRQAVAFAGLNVKIVATHGGLAACHDGGSHQGTEDLALMRAIPGITVLVPCDYDSAYAAIVAAAAHQGPVYVRLQKEPSPDVATDTPFAIGRCRVLRRGADVALVAIGTTTSAAVAAADRLAAAGIDCAVVDVGTLVPLDIETIRGIARGVRSLVTIEEHNLTGGLRDAVACALAGGPGCAMSSIGVRGFGETGTWDELRRLHRLDAEGIVEHVHAGIAAGGSFP
jgi:transketolase